MEAGSGGATRTRPFRLAILAITIATCLALVSIPAFGQDVADGSPPPPAFETDCAAGAGGSPQGYADATPAEAANLLTQGFPCILDSLAADPPEGSVKEDPIDLSLQSEGDSYEPVNPLVPMTLPADLASQVRVGDRGIAVEMGATDPEAAGATSAAPLAGEGLFYADAAAASDVFLAPISTGVEAVYQLRGPESPERFDLAFDLPDGGSLHDAGDGGAQLLQRVEAPAPVDLPDGASVPGTGDGGAEVFERDEWAGTVYAPQATDADGDPVSATMSVTGDSLELDVPHSDPEIAYPIAVTTAITTATLVPGFNASGDALDYVKDISYAPPNYADMEGQIQRTFISWCALQPQPGSGGWSQTWIHNIRQQVHTAQEHGLAPVVTLYTNAPKWTRTAGATGCYANTHASIPQGYAQSYGTAALVLVKCLRNISCPKPITDGYGNVLNGVAPGVRGIEFGNEPNLSDWWNTVPTDPGHEGIPQGDATIYANAAQDAATKIHDDVVAPDLPVGTAGISFNGEGNAGCWNTCGRANAWAYIDTMLASGVQGVNAIGVHPYAPGQHPYIDPGFSPGCGAYCEHYYSYVVNGLRNRMSPNWYPAYASKPIWVTEVGIDADYDDSCENPEHDPDIPCVTAEEEAYQANHLQYLWNTIRWTCSSFNVPMVLFWQAKDDQTYTTSGTPAFMSGFLAKATPGGGVDASKDAYQEFSTYQQVPFPGGISGFGKPLTFTDCVG